MRRAILANGPQGAGKTTFCKEIVKSRPEVILVERDEILIELFGETSLDPYTSDHQYGAQVMWERVGKILAREKEDIDMILDTWCGYPDERIRCARKLRELGSDIVDLWYFVTPEEVCIKQYENREIAQRQARGTKPLPDWQRDSLRSCCRQNFRLYHSLPIEIIYDGQESEFDTIKLINPLQMTLIPYADLLL